MNREGWEILDLQGRPEGDADLPRVDTAPLMVHLYGVNYHAVRDGKLYYIKDNEKTNEWELHVEEIKKKSPGISYRPKQEKSEAQSRGL
jgi:hypothetical protein